MYFKLANNLEFKVNQLNQFLHLFVCLEAGVGLPQCSYGNQFSPGNLTPSVRLSGGCLLHTELSSWTWKFKNGLAPRILGKPSTHLLSLRMPVFKDNCSECQSLPPISHCVSLLLFCSTGNEHLQELVTKSSQHFWVLWREPTALVRRGPREQTQVPSPFPSDVVACPPKPVRADIPPSIFQHSHFTLAEHWRLNWMVCCCSRYWCYTRERPVGVVRSPGVTVVREWEVFPFEIIALGSTLKQRGHVWG